MASSGGKKNAENFRDTERTTRRVVAVLSQNGQGISRRGFLYAGASALGASPLAAASAASSRVTLRHTAIHPPANLKADDLAFLEDYQKRCFRYFWEQWDTRTGLIMDRARMDGAPSSHVASAAATGFGLAAFCIGAERGWISREQARTRVLTTLRFLWGQSFHDHGWFLHFMDARTGQRRLNSEISSVDSSLLLAGVLTVQGYFSSDREIRQLAKQIFDRVDFVWMLNGNPYLLSHGVMPGSGFLKWRWDAYSEASLLYLLAIGALRNPISPESWYAWIRPEVHYQKWKFISGGPLFTHQYAHAWVNFRHQMDSNGTNYFENSQIATYAHRDFCISLQSRYDDYGPDMWGITVSDSADGYVSWGGPPDLGPIDGTLVPCAAAGSLMFTSDICLPVLREMHNVYGDKVYQRYGFTDAFNPNWKNQKLWVNPDVIGIDVGISLVSMENLLTGNVWRWFMLNQYIQSGMERVGFKIATPGIGIKQMRKQKAAVSV